MKNSERKNQTYSNRVLVAEFDDNWRTSLSKSGYVVYTATRDQAKVELLLQGDLKKLLIFPRNGRVLVGGGGTSHFSKPHRTIDL
ncbi:hypothetical protein [Salipaludibacillus aurantiacus]|uniref:Uncharacterized protein n=1 Tax=Salipaludibacillus aurantiacus TaxID=1601833 RepID=A0A1H9Q772_9BACI|nr:hypothetical protein [Salipaludibacillus aurantiacus]SER56287.1 hypothetical protein SAMN05518684_10268 [Salipaludibacillus aurantiacus]